MPRSIFSGFAILAFILGPGSLSAAELRLGSRVLVSTNLADFNISVFPGKSGFEADDESPVVSGAFGDGTVTDFRFFTSQSSALTSYADGGAGMIWMATSPPENTGNVGESWSDLWTTNDPGESYTSPPNHPTSFNTFARTANIYGTIDISTLESGSIYIPHGTYINQWTLTLTMTGPGQPDLTATDTQTNNGPSTNFGWITDFTFSDAAQYDRITYRYTNQDVDGSRGRFMGVILDGTETATTPPQVTNVPATNIQASSATIGGEIVNASGLSTPRLYWGDHDGGTNPLNWDQVIDVEGGSNPFSSNLTNLVPNTTYYFRAFAENSAGEDWADTTSTFQTAPPPAPPVVINHPAREITGIAATLGGEVTDTGGEAPVITIFFGRNDGGIDPDSWDHTVTPGRHDSAFLQTASGLSPLTTYFFRCFAKNSGGEAWAPLSNSFTTTEMSEVFINEFLASNSGSYENHPAPGQVDGRTDDWIEILNVSSTPINLSGWHLTDDENNPTKWTFPHSTIINSNEFLVVYASGDNQVATNGNLHTNFSLDADGEFLALNRPDLSIASSYHPGDPDSQGGKTDVSFGIHPITAAPVFFENPTPGTPNDPEGKPRVRDTKFSIDRGLYGTPMSVEIATSTPSATIYYTIDGSAPIAPDGTPNPSAHEYLVPIILSKTTTLRAAAVKSGFLPTNIDTHSYLFPSAVASQSPAPEGFPLQWGSTPADYEIDPEVVGSTLPGYSLEEALASLPSMTINTAPGELFGATNGIYAYSTQKGGAWERPASLEFIDPDNHLDFQIDCGISIHGASSRSHGMTKKHSLRLLFKREFGEAKLTFPLFEGEETDEFDVLILRACSTDSFPVREGGNNFGVQRWRSQDGSYQRDQWMRDSQIDLGHHSARGRYLHLYLNGLYWGVYNLVERPNNSFNSSHFGGDDEDWDVIHDRGELQSGDFNAWNQMFALADSDLSADAAYMRLLGRNPDGSPNAAYPVYLDLDHFIDYMILHIYAGAEDWPCHNYWASRRRGPDSEGFRFYVWDQEISNNSLIRERTWCSVHFELREKDVPYLSSRSDLRKSPAKLYYQLRQNASFRNQFANRVHELLFNDGLLSPSTSEARWMRRATELDQAIVGESARWGDSRLSTPHKRETSWLSNQEWLSETYWPANHDLAIQRFRNVNLYPSVTAPRFHIDGYPQHGGPVPNGAQLEFGSSSGDVVTYLTNDGSDPRLPDGSVSPSAIAISTPLVLTETQHIRSRNLSTSGGGWSALNSAVFSVDVPLRIVEIMYNPPGDDGSEFLELMNISSESINIGGCYLDGLEEGIDFTFDHLEPPLAPGGRIIVARDLVAFSLAHNTEGIRLALGDYSASGTRLSNEGEELTLRNCLGGLIQQFAYDDQFPWPVHADGQGPSLVLQRPLQDPDPGMARNWRPSFLPGGNPGVSDATSFSGETEADLVSYALPDGGNPTIDSQDGHLVLAFTRDLRAEDVRIEIQSSRDLNTWLPADDLFQDINTHYQGAKGVRATLKVPLSDLGSGQRFFRFHVELVE